MSHQINIYYFKEKHGWKKTTQEFRLKNTAETWNYFVTEEIDQNDLMGTKHKKVWAILNYIQHLLILTSVVTWCVSISTFASLIGIGLKIRIKNLCINCRI